MRHGLTGREREYGNVERARIGYGSHMRGVQSDGQLGRESPIVFQEWEKQ